MHILSISFSSVPRISSSKGGGDDDDEIILFCVTCVSILLDIGSGGVVGKGCAGEKPLGLDCRAMRPLFDLINNQIKASSSLFFRPGCAAL